MSPSPSASAPATSRAATSPSRWASKSSSTLKAISHCYISRASRCRREACKLRNTSISSESAAPRWLLSPGLLQLKGHRITGSDQAAYPPMSNLLRDLGIPIAEPFSASNLEPAPDLDHRRQCHVARQCRSGGHARPAYSIYLTGRASSTKSSLPVTNRWSSPGPTAKPPPPACSPGFTRSPRAATRSLRHRSSSEASRKTSAPAFISARGARSSSKAMSTTPLSSIRARSSCIISLMR